MDYSTPGFPVHHQLPESTQTHVHRVGDAMAVTHVTHGCYSCPLSHGHELMIYKSKF